MIDWEAQFSAALIADDHHPTQAEGPAQMPGRIGNGTASQFLADQSGAGLLGIYPDQWQHHHLEPVRPEVRQDLRGASGFPPEGEVLPDHHQRRVQRPQDGIDEPLCQIILLRNFNPCLLKIW